MSLNDELIALVFAKRCLWDQQNKLYHNRHIVDQYWNEIAKELNQDVVCVKKKWKQLRDTFRSELKKIPPERSGDAGPDGVNQTYSQWAHFKSMMFVKDQFKCRKSSGNLTQQRQTKSVEEIFNVDEEDNSSTIDVDAEVSKLSQRQKNIDYSCESNMGSFEVNTPTTSQNARRNFKRRHNVMEAEIIDIEKKKLSLMEEKSKKKIQNDDEDMAFFISLLPHIRKMDPETKLVCRMEIQTSVYNHAYKNVHSRTQCAQNRNRYVHVPSPIIYENVSQFSDNASSPQDPFEYVSEEDISTHAFQQNYNNNSL